MGSVAACGSARRTLAEVPAEQRHEVEAKLAAEHENEAGAWNARSALGVIDESWSRCGPAGDRPRDRGRPGPPRRSRNIPL